MLLVDLLQETYVAITANKVRSALTILGIVIGIASVIALLGLGTGMQDYVKEQIEAGGSNLLMISPGEQKRIGSQTSIGRGTAQSLVTDDAEAIASEISGVSEVASSVTSNYQVVADGANTSTSIVGTESSYPLVTDMVMDLGSFLSDQQNKTSAKVAVLGPTVAEDLFGEDVDPVGEKVRINKINFTVIGVTEETGGMMSTDSSIFVPLTTAQRYFTGDEYLSMIYVKVADQETMSTTESEITSLLLKRHDIDDELLADFSMMNMEDLVDMASSILGTMTVFVGAIAGISLLVGGIGIMNMMLTTVTERTREIGLRKSIGAQKKDITTQFLVESTVLTLIGGLIGIILGWVASLALEGVMGFPPVISWWSIVLAFGVSAFIGIVFGYYPARRAAKLNPIEALRYE